MAAERTQERWALHCSCGGCVTESIAAGDSLRQLREVWFAIHAGPGHEPFDWSVSEELIRRAAAIPSERGRKDGGE